MVLSISVTDRISLPKSHTMIYGVITFDASYLTGGELIAAADLKFQSLDNLLVFPTEDGFIPSWDPSAGTIILYESGTAGAPLDEVTSAQDRSTTFAQFIAFGRS